MGEEPERFSADQGRDTGGQKGAGGRLCNDQRPRAG